MRLHYALAFVSLLLALMVEAPSAMYLQVTGPVQATLHQNSSIYLGKVGPGESFYVEASAATTNATGKFISIGWDTLEAVSLPSGWSSEQSPLYANPMKLKITVAPNAPNGTYNMVIRAVNVQNYSRLGNLTVNAYVNVTPDVFTASIAQNTLYSGIGQPTNVQILLNNTGASDDPFVISSSGLPAFNLSYEVIARKGVPAQISYPVFENEPGVYKFTLSITSATSPIVHKSYKLKLVVKSNLANDYAATGQGFLISPIIYEPTYAFMLLVDAISKLL